VNNEEEEPGWALVIVVGGGASPVTGNRFRRYAHALNAPNPINRYLTDSLKTLRAKALTEP
jgi:hypothetical protein